MRIIVTLILLCCVLTTTAQTDKWTGTWRMEHKPYATAAPIQIELQIGKPERNALYPAQLKLSYGEFSGIYELLLAKKNDGQLGIGRNKFPIQEKPFRLGSWMLYLNGTLDYNKNVLSLKRMWISSFGLFMKGLYDDDEIYESTKVEIRNFLYQDSIALKKINNTPWVHLHTNRILHPEKDSIYFGIYDKITLSDPMLNILIRDEDAIDKDTVSLVLNGNLLLDRAFISSEDKVLAISLDTGMNILTFFADNYGRLPPNTGAFRARTDSGYYTYDFSQKPNAYATFLVAQFYRTPPPFKPVPVVSPPPRITGPVPVSPPARVSPPAMVSVPSLSELKKLQPDPRITSRKNSLVDQLTVTTPEAVLELWDDAAEDGDSVSIRLNDRLIVAGFPVLKQRQQLSVVLEPGENRLLLLADNLGSIPPNTAVMRITAGTTKKYVRIKTDLKQNNLLLINYQPPAP
ncbi:hypothetical protein SAMN05428988_0575 [Chitinophaga sp. YR573]|uniref:hypothetical protein n=1 Tax=Chitinophaga sp. YR573 TaxID=1881040 RepID=UPI0008B4A134|nr:hypothetical protein [Chitinophaga sp. YR573]SEV93366.1 hypothetical protein SAMN05428988_0575 [Chitinophaga sp. YR573]